MPGNDRVDGGPGPDIVLGGQGNDTLLGGGGNDQVIDRDRTANHLSGGRGDDLIVT